MKNLLFGLIYLFSSSVLLGFQGSSVSDQLRLKLESENPQENILVAGKELQSGVDIHRFYADRNFQEVWSKDGILLEFAYEMRFEIKQSRFDGLNPEDYGLALIEAFFQSFEKNKEAKKANEPGDLANLELLLTDAFFELAEDLERGKVDPSQLKGDWDIDRKPQRANYSELFKKAISEKDIRRNLESLYPKFTIYKRGREVLRALDERLKTDTLDWKAVRVDKSIKVGDSNNAIPALRERLQYWDYLSKYQVNDPKLYDSTMYQGVMAFQKKNGMEPDGVIGKNTATGLNASPSILIDKAAVNLERLRWLPDTVQNLELIVVNIANFQLDYINKLDTLFSSKVIVGKLYHESPIFTAPMSYIVFSPYWNIPNSITRKEIIPAIRKNPNYLKQKNMEVITTSGKYVDPSSVNWSSKSFPYLIRQKPGGSNSLGLVKFMFPNSHSVYIHDTPARSLFEKEDRALSHGCIRLQNPAKFAEILLSGDGSWTPEKIDQAMHRDSEMIVNLPRKIPVVLLYLTFWADSKGQANFRQDIYNRDAEVLALLKK
ncbi:murein L,D-transpeptidase YcbB/YkuD [Algoriphagus boseongensis]|uniref:Murein L,D-transpeptidase YcbB/YkuD n=1 Tax=Algoriphagus boseongensis TaxID=1442587 RepID=A0A4R6TA72_9BACT|nr:L,D-transpeptidase family protein [Algoriphagus boseongensis]TDQ18324.1 murein L,D-transpeptidase YcbB/YkuD [Algoriphagus boseongensis]